MSYGGFAPRCLAALSLLSFVAGCGPGATALLPIDTALAVDFHSGKAYSYNLQMTSALTETVGSQDIPVKMDLSGTSTMRVTGVDIAGVSTIHQTIQFTTTTVNGQSIDLAGKVPTAFDFRITKSGQLLSFGPSSDGSAGGGSSSGFDQLTALLPDGKVKPGDTWTKTIDQNNPFGGGSVQITTTNKFLRYETFQGNKAAVIESKGAPQIDITLALADVIKTLGATVNASALQQLGGVTAHVVGTESFDRTSWVDPARKELLHTASVVNMDLREDLSNLPASMRLSAVSILLKGKITFSIEKA